MNDAYLNKQSVTQYNLSGQDHQQHKLIFLQEFPRSMLFRKEILKPLYIGYPVVSIRPSRDSVWPRDNDVKA